MVVSIWVRVGIGMSSPGSMGVELACLAPRVLNWALLSRYHTPLSDTMG